MIYASLNAKKEIISIQQLLLQLQNFLQSQKQQSFQQEDTSLMEIIFSYLSRIRQQLQQRIREQKAIEIILIIQYLSQENEVQGYAPLLPGVTGEEPAGKDNIFYADVENEQFVTLHPGEFTVYFTNDIHRPNCTMDEPVNIHKAVC